MAEFNFPVDIGNRALQRVGSELMDITLGFSELSKRAQAVSTCYGKLRRAELQRNLWPFATRKAAIRPLDTNTMLVSPTLWSSTVTYFVGSIVSDANGTLWKSILRNNLNNQPGQIYTAWVPYFGPMTAAPFDSSQNYFSGELVYTFGGDGTNNVFESRVSGNAVHPALPNQWSTDTIYNTDDVVQQFPAWSSGTTYSQGQGALYTDGNVYVSLTNGNVGNAPPSSASNWALMPTLTLTSQLVPSSSFPAPTQVTTTPIDEWQIETGYALGAFAIWKAAVYVSIVNNNTGNFPSNGSFWVAVSNGTLYQSLVDLNLGNSPASSPTQWTSTFTQGGGNSQWMQIGGAAFPNGASLTALAITWPVNAGPLSQTWSKNVYRLPAGYLRRAPQDPSAGNVSWLGAPSNDTQQDWVINGNYLVSADSFPIVFRFVADVQNVQEFPDTFCEGLACRIGLEVCETLTQSTAKLQGLGSLYKEFMGEARMIGAIEIGGINPPLDDLIMTRR